VKKYTSQPELVLSVTAPERNGGFKSKGIGASLGKGCVTPTTDFVINRKESLETKTDLTWKEKSPITLTSGKTLETSHINLSANKFPEWRGDHPDYWR
jgi:hypothetical protein